ncbi:hypothetical protein I4U23_002468 [Adineta vaga]|nr:hypothetical protein I4U23_002468 [Adineta vaga]
MTSENSFDTIHKEVSSNEEKNVSSEQQSLLIIKDINSEEEPADVSFETRLVVDEKVKINDVSKTESESTEDEEMDTHALFEQPVLVEGKRSRKPTLRLELAEPTSTKKELTIPEGRGKSLGEIEYINYQISHASTDALTRMRFICFGRRGNSTNIRKYLREFNGFAFECKSDEYRKHLSNLTKLKKDQLQSISLILGLSSTGRNIDHAERILNFLMEPTDEGKGIPKKKTIVRKKKSKAKNENGTTEHKIRRKKDVSKENKEETVKVIDIEKKEIEQSEQNEIVNNEKVQDDN